MRQNAFEFYRSKLVNVIYNILVVYLTYFGVFGTFIGVLGKSMLFSVFSLFPWTGATEVHLITTTEQGTTSTGQCATIESTRGVPVAVACKLRKERMAAIAEMLGKGEYDIVLLQEVWTESDFQLMRQSTSQQMPYVHYFRSGTIGSGVCVFSKIPIQETMYHLFPLNGYAHKIHHADWFGGKGVGMCRMKLGDLTIHLYNTHLHAGYVKTEEYDEYKSHRVSQAFEMSQFIKHTSGDSDLVIVGGDLNLQPKELGYKIIVANAKLTDCWVEQNNGNMEGGYTNERPENSFCSRNFLKTDPEGRRIDYLLYKVNRGKPWKVDSCEVFTEKFSNGDSKVSYSDHEAVIVTLKTEGKTEVLKPEAVGKSPLVTDLLEEALQILDEGIQKADRDNTFYTIMAVSMVVILYAIWGVDLATIEVPLIRGVIFVTLTLLAGFFVWYKVVINRIEKTGLIGTKQDITNLLNSLRNSDK